VEVQQKVINMGVIDADPTEYRHNYKDTMVSELPQFVRDIKPPEGLRLAADHPAPSNVVELEGDIEALKLVADLDREGLGAYREFLVSMGVLSPASAASSSSNNMSGLIAEIFSYIDRDRDSLISVAEAERVLLRLNSRFGRHYGEDDVKALFAALDADKDGHLSLEEFRLAFANLKL
jgi:hypothetical protein